MKAKKLITVVGAASLLLGMGMNMRHSLNDYGLATNKLAKYVLAQDSSEDEGGGSNGEWIAGYKMERVKKCTRTKWKGKGNGGSNIGGGLEYETETEYISCCVFAKNKTYVCNFKYQNKNC